MATTQTHINRSYTSRPVKGDYVMFEAPAAIKVYDGIVDRLEVDTFYCGIVRSVTNAGFRGIEISVDLDDGGSVSGISAGAIIDNLGGA